MRPAGDAEFVQIVDAALADAAARSGHWLACRPGCNQCCTGVFRISPLDAERLREGLSLLHRNDPESASRVARRVQHSVTHLAADYPGELASGTLYEDDESLERFEDFGNDEVCPVLDPLTGTCDLYAHRPLTCRTFGPPVRIDDGDLGVCELCFAGAPSEAVSEAEMKLPSPEVEQRLIGEIGRSGDTIIAFALRQLD